MADESSSDHRPATISEVASTLLGILEKHGDMPVYFVSNNALHPIFLPHGLTLGQLHDDIKDERTEIVIIL